MPLSTSHQASRTTGTSSARATSSTTSGSSGTSTGTRTKVSIFFFREPRQTHPFALPLLPCSLPCSLTLCPNPDPCPHPHPHPRRLNTGWEHLNHLLKRFFLTRTQRGGSNGAKARASRVKSVGKWMQRRFLWLCDLVKVGDLPAAGWKRESPIARLLRAATK
jgi:hypothetical protein